MQDLIRYVLGVAAKSNIEKRQVGCIIVGKASQIVAEGYNDEEGHAEHNACEDFCARAVEPDQGPFTAYVTHAPCPACAKMLIEHGIQGLEVVEAFKKFDSDKLRYDLIPPSMTKALAEVLTFGARKYAPNNWKNNTEMWRFEAALLRHIEAYRSGELLDPGTGLSHLAHAATNIAFLIELTGQTESSSD
jgi:deoxycytidylate deaminase